MHCFLYTKICFFLLCNTKSIILSEYRGRGAESIVLGGVFEWVNGWSGCQCIVSCFSDMYAELFHPRPTCKVCASICFRRQASDSLFREYFPFRKLPFDWYSGYCRVFLFGHRGKFSKIKVKSRILSEGLVEVYFKDSVFCTHTTTIKQGCVNSRVFDLIKPLRNKLYSVSLKIRLGIAKYWYCHLTA